MKIFPLGRGTAISQGIARGMSSVGCAGVAATETPPSTCGAFPPLIGGIFKGVVHVGLADATGHENAAPSRDHKGAVEAVCRRGRPFLTVGARISVIFT